MSITVIVVLFLTHLTQASKLSPVQRQEIDTTWCPDHRFHTIVGIDCIYDGELGSTFVPYIRIHALSVIDSKLNNTKLVDQHVIHEGKRYPFAPELLVDIMSYQKDDYTDATQFIEKQEEAGDDFVDKLIGVAIDGVPIYTAVGPGGYDILEPSGSYSDIKPLSVDACGGSYGPTPDGIRYHYRTIPACVIPHVEPRHRDFFPDPSTWSTPITNLSQYDLNLYEYQAKRRMQIHDMIDLLQGFDFTPALKYPQIIGWTLQGHPIYSPFNERGLLHENLDNCNGKFDSHGMYGYYSKPTFPYLVGCIGPGLYSLSEEHSTLEMLPSAIGSYMNAPRKYNACPGGYFPSSSSNIDNIVGNKGKGSTYSEIETNACEPCPAGKYTTGTYMKAGQSINSLEGCRNICPVGNFCPQASSKPIKCPAGRFGSQTGLTNADCSGPCYKGYYCIAASVRPDPFPCGLGSVYCPEGSPVRIPVVIGWYSIPQNSNENYRSDQARCGPGTYCSQGFRYPCPAGRYGSSLELSTSNCSSHCPIGHYCPLSSPQAIPCPAGTYGSTISLQTIECSGKCKPGYYCPQGSTQNDQIPCAAGIYGAEEGLQTKECSPFCEHSGAPNNTNSAGAKFCESRNCASGYYCPTASISAKQMKCGSASVYCPPSSVLPTPVSIGYYTIGNISVAEKMQVVTTITDINGQSGVIPTEYSDELVRIAQIICEPGFYCIQGIRYKCPLGSYGSTSGLFTKTCSGLCHAGYLCPLNSTSAEQEQCGVDARVYCPQGSYEPIVVPAGYYSLGDDVTTRQYILPCPPGMWCINGIKHLCSAGKYSINGSPTSQCDGLCEKGYWCSEGSSSPTQYDCPAGKYGHLGMTNNACKGTCRIGYYCPVNSYSPTQIECGGDMYYCPHGSGDRIAVSVGYFSAGGNQTTRSEQIKCDIGTYIGTPPEGKVRTSRCPDTTAP